MAEDVPACEALGRSEALDPAGTTENRAQPIFCHWGRLTGRQQSSLHKCKATLVRMQYTAHPTIKNILQSHLGTGRVLNRMPVFTNGKEANYFTASPSEFS